MYRQFTTLISSMHYVMMLVVRMKIKPRRISIVKMKRTFFCWFIRIILCFCLNKKRRTIRIRGKLTIISVRVSKYKFLFSYLKLLRNANILIMKLCLEKNLLSLVLCWIILKEYLKILNFFFSLKTPVWWCEEGKKSFLARVKCELTDRVWYSVFYVILKSLYIEFIEAEELEL